jgi:hypothetical protein
VGRAAWQDVKGASVLVGSYEEAVKMMGDMNFLQALVNFPKEAINDETVELLQVRRGAASRVFRLAFRARSAGPPPLAHLPLSPNSATLQPYFAAPDFNFESAKKASGNVAGLCNWAEAMCRYHAVAKEVEPKIVKLRASEGELRAAQAERAAGEAELAGVQAALDAMQARFEAAVAHKGALEADAAATRRKMDNAATLVAALGGEEARWVAESAAFEGSIARLAGDCAVASRWARRGSALLSAAPGPFHQHSSTHCHLHSLQLQPAAASSPTWAPSTAPSASSCSPTSPPPAPPPASPPPPTCACPPSWRMTPRWGSGGWRGCPRTTCRCKMGCWSRAPRAPRCWWTRRARCAQRRPTPHSAAPRPAALATPLCRSGHAICLASRSRPGGSPAPDPPAAFPQGRAWLLRRGAGAGLRVTQLGDKRFRAALEEALAAGAPLLVEDVEEDELDPALDAVLERRFLRRGRGLAVALGDKEVEVGEGFRMFLTTRLPNPKLTPELCAKVGAAGRARGCQETMTWQLLF